MLLKQYYDYIRNIEQERDQLLQDIRMLGRMGANICPLCDHYNHGEGNKPQCITCIINRETDNFKWRGVVTKED